MRLKPPGFSSSMPTPLPSETLNSILDLAPSPLPGRVKSKDFKRVFTASLLDVQH